MWWGGPWISTGAAGCYTRLRELTVEWISLFVLCVEVPNKV